MSSDVQNVIAMVKDGFDKFLEDSSKCGDLSGLQVPGHRLMNELALFFPYEFPNLRESVNHSRRASMLQPQDLRESMPIW